jgi:serine/threonine protein kinase, bacterial
VCRLVPGVTNPHCITVKGKGTVPGEDSAIVSSSWEPQLNGTLKGTFTETVVTNECGQQATVWATPFVATRIGDVPPGVMVADPATVSPTPSTNSPVAPTPGPVLDGAYRFDYDLTKATFNGAPYRSSTKNKYWAFRSLCRSTGCVATAAQLDDTIHEWHGITAVFHFIDEEWQDVPVRLELPCSESNTTISATSLSSTSLKPQSDGTLQGVEQLDIQTDECRQQGMPRGTLRLPFVATRIGDSPPGVTVADPALFKPAAAPPTTSSHP